MHKTKFNYSISNDSRHPHVHVWTSRASCQTTLIEIITYRGSSDLTWTQFRKAIPRIVADLEDRKDRAALAAKLRKLRRQDVIDAGTWWVTLDDVS